MTTRETTKKTTCTATCAKFIPHGHFKAPKGNIDQLGRNSIPEAWVSASLQLLGDDLVRRDDVNRGAPACGEGRVGGGERAAPANRTDQRPLAGQQEMSKATWRDN